MKPTCTRCHDTNGPFVVIQELWVCNICAYKQEHPDAGLVDPVRRRAKRQKETLFDPYCYD